MYDRVKVTPITFPEFDFGGGAAETMSFRVPAGYNAKIISQGVMITETFACDTTPASFELGTASDSDAYAKLVIPDGAADNDCYDETDDTDAIIQANISAGTLVRVTLTNGTDSSSVAGKGVPVVWLELTPAY